MNDEERKKKEQSPEMQAFLKKWSCKITENDDMLMPRMLGRDLDRGMMFFAEYDHIMGRQKKERKNKKHFGKTTKEWLELAQASDGFKADQETLNAMENHIPPPWRIKQQ